MSETESTGNGRTRRWLGILLTLSLAINLLIAGAVAGALWMRSGHDGPGHPRSGMVGGPLTRALEPEARREIGRALRAVRAEAGGSRAARVASMDRILEELTRVPFEPEALDAAGLRQERLGAVYRTFRVFGISAHDHPDRHGDRDRLGRAGDMDRHFRDAAAEPVGGDPCFAWGEIREDQQKFLPADARDDILRAQRPAKPFGHMFEHPVAGGVAIAVVDPLEMIEIGEHHRKRGASLVRGARRAEPFEIRNGVAPVV